MVYIILNDTIQCAISVKIQPFQAKQPAAAVGQFDEKETQMYSSQYASPPSFSTEDVLGEMDDIGAKASDDHNQPMNAGKYVHGSVPYASRAQRPIVCLQRWLRLGRQDFSARGGLRRPTLAVRSSWRMCYYSSYQRIPIRVNPLVRGVYLLVVNVFSTVDRVITAFWLNICNQFCHTSSDASLRPLDISSYQDHDYARRSCCVK